MEPDLFTHTFEFNINGVVVKGAVEFDSDNKVSMEITQTGIPLQSETLQYILDFFDLIKKIKDSDGTINLIKIKKKD